MERLNLNPLGQSAQSFNPAEFAKIKADSENKKTGDLRGYDCPKCLNRGRIFMPRDDGSVVPVDCDCLKIRRFVSRAEASGISGVLEKTFDQFVEDQPWRATIKAGAMAYADSPRGCLLLCGQSGSGKSHLCTAVCRHLLLTGEEVRYMPWRNDIRELKGMAKEPSIQAEALKKYQEAPVLFIDDLFKVSRAADGSRNPKQADVDLAYDIIEYRCTKQLTTIISTERSLAELVEIDEAVGSRITEMAGDNIYYIEEKPGRNYRLRGVKTV